MNSYASSDAVAALLMRRLPVQGAVDPVQFRARSFSVLQQPAGLLIEDGKFNQGVASLEIRQHPSGSYALLATTSTAWERAECATIDKLADVINELMSTLFNPDRLTLQRSNAVDLQDSTQKGRRP